MSLISAQSINTIVYEVCCSKCHKVRQVHMDVSMAGSKDLNSIECLCGHKIPIDILKYIFRSKDYMESRMSYFIC